jgi:5-methyltetrahydrofolate--homocysteine methyltransferase
VLEPHLKIGETSLAGKVVIGTVKGDIHDIGKNLVATFLGLLGSTVTDLDVEVDLKKYIEIIKRIKQAFSSTSGLMHSGLGQVSRRILT